MNIIDGKGRLFGKINVVDFTILFIFLITVPVFFHVYTILGKRPTRIPHEWVRVEAVTFTIPEIAGLFEEGDIACDREGNTIGRLIKITKKDREYSDGLKSTIIAQANDKKSECLMPIFLEFELLCAFSRERKIWYYQREIVTVGLKYAFYFTTDKYAIDCYTLKIGD